MIRFFLYVDEDAVLKSMISLGAEAVVRESFYFILYISSISILILMDTLGLDSRQSRDKNKIGK